MSALDVLFGPPSKSIQVSHFIRAANEADGESNVPSVGSISRNEWSELAESRRKDVEDECRVDDLRSTLNEVIENPRLMAHVTRTHEATVHAIHEAADTSNRRKRKRPVIPEPAEQHPEVATLRQQLEASKLRSWPTNAALFIRPPRQADHNALINAKRLAFATGDASPQQALIFVTVYNPISWGHRQLGRASQHVFLSSQSLGDIFDAIPCTSHEIMHDNVQRGSQATGTGDRPVIGGQGGAVIFMDGQLYGDGQSAKDYADKYLEYLSGLPERRRIQGSKATPMHDTPLDSLDIRLHTPHWILHAGDCIHHITFDQIRLLHPEDPPPDAYPLTTQITPPLLDLCRACNKVPAVLAIVGDVRLGESPFVICRPCWKWMGPPRGDDADEVSVVSLPKHEFGWSA
ncbi:hypothetical protein EIP91_011737 [Steccherinum ochraceum]|uniref:snRNA-activating protein complex subunit 3 n=1 Tax=Steccherinum ochraceum TaxID=92696 RepID=A0A4R0RYD1_9APHY|nr:hypothetical protein EIP91_011737 [Steccherinum ochraceum]